MRTLFTYILVSFVVTIQAQQYNLVWEKSFGGTNTDRAHDLDFKQNGNLLISGLTYSSNGDVSTQYGSCDYWVVETDTDGNLISEVSFGGTGYDWLDCLVPTNDGGYILGGHSTSINGDVSGNHGDYDAWVVKVDDSNQIEWSRCYGGSNNDYCKRIITTSDGGYAFVGNSLSSDGDLSGNYGSKDYWVVKLTSLGDIEWSNHYGGSGNDHGYGIMEDSNGNIVVNGYTDSSDGDVQQLIGVQNLWLLKLSSEGNIVWEKTMGGTSMDYGYEVLELDNGNYLFSGQVTSSDVYVTQSYGLSDIWLVEIQPNGNFYRNKTLGASSSDFYGKVTKLDNGNILLTASTKSNDGMISGNNSPGAFDYWTAELDSDYNLIWQKCLGGSLRDYGQSIVRDSENNVFVAGYSESTDGDISANIGSNDYWLVKLSNNTTSIDLAEDTETIKIYPNPTNSSGFSVESEESIESVALYSITGEKVKNINNLGRKEKIDIQGITNGMYILRVKTCNNIYQKELLINK